MTGAPEVVGTYTLGGEWCDIKATIVRNGDLYYPLTPCCQATGTGTDDGTCCRVCYDNVDSIFGIVWTELEWTKELYRLGRDSD